MAKIKKSIQANNFLLTLSSAVLILIFLSAFLFYSSSSVKNFTTIKIGENSIRAEIVETEDKRATGLTVRNSLDQDSGMIFVFDKAEYHPFWMKEMNFSIDIIWINNGKIVDITHQAKPEGADSKYFTIYKPDEPVKFVLEIPSGYAKQNNIKIGDSVESPIFR